MDASCDEVSVSATQKIEVKEETQNNEKGNDGGSSPSSRSSPEANCPICLGKPENKSFTDSCLHQFCFTCLLEWSKVKAVCPLCKQSFKSIIHNVRSIEDYEQYYLSTTATTESRVLGIIARLEPDQPREPFRYRTTAVSSYLDYFVRLEEAISHHVIPSVPVPTHSSNTHWHRRRQYGTSDFRRNIYQQGLWVQRMGDLTGRVRDCSPEFFRANPALVHRLVPWLNRELNVLCGTNELHVQHVMSRILDLITQVPIRSSGFSAAVSVYIGRHTEHFVHEFYSFASSPYDLMGFDRNASYVNQASLAHTLSPERSDNDDDSDVQIVGSYPTTTSPLPSIQLDSGSDSDECVVVDSVPAPPCPPSPEVITLESDDEVVQVNIHIGTTTGPDMSRPGPSRRPPLKRNWLTVKNMQVPSTSSDNLNVSINIARGSRSLSSSSSERSSSSWRPYLKKSKTKDKDKKKKPKEQKGNKGKSLIKSKKSFKIKPSCSTNNDDGSVSPVILVRKRRPSIVLKSSSDDEDDSNVLHTETEQSLTTSSDESEYKPRLRSVVVKSEPRPASPRLSSSPTRSDYWTGSNSGSHSYDYMPHTYSSFNPDVPESSNTDWSYPKRRDSSYRSTSYSTSSSERPPRKKCKNLKKRLRRERF